MYKRSNQGWLKHLDFILWDEFALQLAYILAFLIRHGRLLYYRDIYRTLGILLVLFDFLVATVFNTMHNVMKRKLYREFTESLKQVALVLAMMSLYLFSTQSGDVYSRIIIYLTSGLHLVLGMGIRLLWKQVIRRRNRAHTRTTMILVADEKDVPEVMEKAKTTDGFDYAGIVLSNRDAKGEEIAGTRVVANLSDSADYFCREWVDEVFIYSGVTEKRVLHLMEQCREMAIPVHLCVPVASTGGKVFIEKVGGFSVMTTTANYASPGQLALKRLLDILGGFVGSLAALGIIAVIGPKIKKESPGPILFRQTRIGLNGKKFTCYKIRSMYLDAEERKQELMAENRVSDGMMFKLDWDPRIIGNKIVDGKQVTGIGEMI
ncbi:MAG: sugar transferase, partial [Desulfovibrionaceae bacterium]|nr:sugar transferase [Desulfovibrionaceae bacterium]